MKQCKQCREFLEKQAKKILKHMNINFAPVEVGYTVQISIPDVNRSRGSTRNVLAVVVVENIYKLCLLIAFQHAASLFHAIPILLIISSSNIVFSLPLFLLFSYGV